jgi:hypothetical protein
MFSSVLVPWCDAPRSLLKGSQGALDAEAVFVCLGREERRRGREDGPLLLLKGTYDQIEDVWDIGCERVWLNRWALGETSGMRGQRVAAFCRQWKIMFVQGLGKRPIGEEHFNQHLPDGHSS